ncbi:hypothetical protein JHK82_036462 [Glycine max]|nr:hypothetical protein JHK85_037192 [Glycine max]KAG5113193.1 hypothetical protein JHK82_036462 [Glycine max]
MEESEKAPQLVQVLEALKEATHDIQRHHSSDSPPIKALLQLHTILSSSDPNLSALSDHLNRLKTLVDSLNNSKGLRSFFTRPPLHALPLTPWIDRETLHRLSASLRNPNINNNDLVALLTQFRDRVSQGFNRELQDLVLKLKLFSSLESVLFDAKCPNRVRVYVIMYV